MEGRSIVNYIYKIAGLFFLIAGPINFYLGVWGEMYTNPEFADYLGYLQLYVLRPLLIISIFAVPYGIWLLMPAVWRWMLGNLYECALEDEYMDRDHWHQLADEERVLPKATCWNRPWRMLQMVWYARRCFIGRHPEDALWYSDGGEDGPRGTTCADCGRTVSLDDVTRLTTSEPDIPLPDRGPRAGDTVLWDIPVQPDPFRPFPDRCDKEG